MNHTTNYQLSQWESTDRILMSDFNSDNSKIDAALKARLASFTPAAMKEKEPKAEHFLSLRSPCLWW